MTAIESIYAKRQLLDSLRTQSAATPIHCEAKHNDLFNEIWRLTNELKALEAAVTDGVELPYIRTAKPINLFDDDDMGDDFTRIPIDPIGTDRPEPVDKKQQELNGILFILEMLEKMPETDARNKEIGTYQKELYKFYQ